jgi:hypothetical protein
MDLINKYNIDILEEKYLLYINKYSLSYISGSLYYVGPSFKKYINSLSIIELKLKSKKILNLIYFLKLNHDVGIDPQKFEGSSLIDG